MAELIVSGLTRTYGAVKAIDNVSFTVKDGEFLTLLGPSGCGKSTTLFSIAGLDRPTTGRIQLGSDMFFDSGSKLHLAPENRNCGLVFQSYALWPHMSVRQNVEFPLKLRKITGNTAGDKVARALGLVEMGAYADRYPHELSGGQQQRVALARTLVYEPQLLLLDEPLSNLDAKLRLRARGWLRELQTRLKITTLYVTHDQDEALALSDRIAVMSGGRIIQLGTPHEIYREPKSPFIADFVGHSNLLSGRAQAHGSGLAVLLSDEQRIVLSRSPDGTAASNVTVGIRPEHIVLHTRQSQLQDENFLKGRIIQRDFLGTHYEYLVAVSEHLLRVTSTQEVEQGEVLAELPAAACMPFWGDNHQAQQASH
ncbi:ABC transporter ATP-binding protein [Janthinobacterium sp. 17J80-10]|uniref:ABC transporter ATP-binding protein n=1 Tax=Janthinobacterium sp. 17J80-10 TaxID=2497863 RepID=UPI0010056DBF|nr:ABC transporter ATP-binding protein [Janthinobacterium sp. 17J80-10]QAU35710.1 ABC transporter ATP-binding protein [Janthinobacterium sp. 17J80-10]